MNINICKGWFYDLLFLCVLQIFELSSWYWKLSGRERSCYQGKLAFNQVCLLFNYVLFVIRGF